MSFVEIRSFRSQRSQLLHVSYILAKTSAGVRYDLAELGIRQLIIGIDFILLGWRKASLSLGWET